MRSPTRTQLAISLSIDGEVLQNSNTRELVFKIPELIEYISSITPLLARRHRLHRHAIRRGHGPQAASAGSNPANVTVTVEGLGSLTNPVVAE